MNCCCFDGQLALLWLQEAEDGDAGDAGCSRPLGLVVEPSVERSTEICAGVDDQAESPAGARDSHVVVTDSSPVELYLDNSQHHFLLVFTGKLSVRLQVWRGGAVVTAFDLQRIGRGFDARLRRCRGEMFTQAVYIVSQKTKTLDFCNFAEG